MPFFSIIMPAFNASQHIDEAIISVLEQRFTDWELIVVNDGSTDNTPDIVQKYVDKDIRIKLISQENKRLGAARNTGLRNATGTWIAFLDSDDSWLANKLERQKSILDSNPAIDVIFSDGYSIFEEVDIRLYYHFPVAKGLINGLDMYKIEIENNQIPILSAMLKKEWVDKIGFQDENVNAFGSEDWDYWLRLAAEGAMFYGMEDRLFNYRVHSGGMSSRVWKQKYGSTYILFKNFKPNLLTSYEVGSFYDRMATFKKDLIKNGYKEYADEIDSKLTQLNHLSKKDNISIRQYFQILINNIFLLSKEAIKSLAIMLINTLLFIPYKKFKHHSHHLAIQYHRWLHGKKLDIRGYFYMNISAKINIDPSGSTFTTYGISVNDYSNINLSGNAILLTGKDVVINKFCHFNIWSAKVKIGNNVLFNNYCSLNSMEEIEIGDNTWFGEGVRLYDHNHKFKDRTLPFTSQGMATGKIKIGNNVWIGSNTVILQNVTIGDGAVIGANNLIYKSVPANCIVKTKAMDIIEEIIK